MENENVRRSDRGVACLENSPGEVDVLAAVAGGEYRIGDATGRFNRATTDSKAAGAQERGKLDGQFTREVVDPLHLPSEILERPTMGVGLDEVGNTLESFL